MVSDVAVECLVVGLKFCNKCSVGQHRFASAQKKPSMYPDLTLLGFNGFHSLPCL